MEIKELEGADSSLVYLDERWKSPHCKIHGAMNRLSVENPVYRCITTSGEAVSGDVKKRFNKNGCRAGCVYE